jgi:hypothetical protein
VNAAAAGRYAVVIVLDGARPDYFNLVPMPHLRALMHSGTVYSNAFVGQLLANTPPSHATIGTGMFPKHDGVEGFLWENPQTSTVLNPTETGSVLHGDLERVEAEHHVPSLAGEIRRVYPRGKTVSVAGHKCYASDAMGTPSADYILCALIYHNRWVAQAIPGHMPPPGAINNPAWDVPIPPRTAGFGPAVQQFNVGAENRWTMRYALWAFKRIHAPGLLMINLSETDVLGHFAPNNSVIKTLMTEFDGLLGTLEDTYRKAGILDKTEFVVTADHGMSRIHTFVPYHNFTVAMQEAGATPVYVEHDTAAAMGIVQNGKARAVALNLFRLEGKAADATYYKVLVGKTWMYRLAAAQPSISKAELHAYVTLADTAAASSGPDVLGVFAPHVSSRNFAAYGYQWRAGHLGPQWDDQHIPLVISGPGVRRGVTSTYPARLVDLAPTIEQLVGARSGKVDGVVLQDAMTKQDADGLAAQKARGRALGPIVKALKARVGL